VNLTRHPLALPEGSSFNPEIKSQSERNLDLWLIIAPQICRSWR